MREQARMSGEGRNLRSTRLIAIVTRLIGLFLVNSAPLMAQNASFAVTLVPPTHGTLCLTPPLLR